jgi:hypothetical protein
VSRENSKLENLVDQLICETNHLLSTIIQRTKQSDQKPKLQKPRWTERHRLQILLEAAQETKKHLPKGIVAPWFLAELRATIELVRRWHDKPIWKEIEPSLVNSTHFTHTVAKLHIAEHLMKEGHKVEIIPKGENASPDLRVQAIGGTQDWVNIECYQPKIFDGGSTVEQQQIERVVKQSMKKAKRQLEKTTPGILAICGFNQTRQTLENLKQMILNRLQKTERSHLCGMIIMMLGIMCRKSQEHISFTPTISFDFIPNPNYFGRVDIDVSTPTDDPRVIKGPLTDVRTEDIFSQKIDQVSEVNIAGSASVTKETAGGIVEQSLKLVKEPTPKSRVIIYSENNTLPFFKGEGNINSLCGRCRAILVKLAWKLSISNIIVKCPICQSYNEFPKLELPEHPILGTIAITKENYNFTGTVVLKRGASIVGL